MFYVSSYSKIIIISERERRGRERIPKMLHTQCRAWLGARSHNPEITTEQKPKVGCSNDCATQEPHTFFFFFKIWERRRKKEWANRSTKAVLANQRNLESREESRFSVQHSDERLHPGAQATCGMRALRPPAASPQGQAERGDGPGWYQDGRSRGRET